jgi:hypothetical protein
MAKPPQLPHHVPQKSMNTRWQHAGQVMGNPAKSSGNTLISICSRAKQSRMMVASKSFFVELMQTWENNLYGLTDTTFLLDKGYDVGAAHAFFMEMEHWDKDMTLPKNSWPATSSTLTCPGTYAELSLVHNYQGVDPAYNFLDYFRKFEREGYVTPSVLAYLIEEIEVSLVFQMPPETFPAFHPRDTFPEQYRQALIYWKGAFTKFLEQVRSSRIQLY